MSFDPNKNPHPSPPHGMVVDSLPPDSAEYLDGAMPNYAEPLWANSPVGNPGQQQLFQDEGAPEWRADKDTDADGDPSKDTDKDGDGGKVAPPQAKQ